jgi:hypothetical protein
LKFTPDIIFAVDCQEVNIAVYNFLESIRILVIPENPVICGNVETSIGVLCHIHKAMNIRIVWILQIRRVPFVLISVKALYVVLEKNPNKSVVVLNDILYAVVVKTALGRKSMETVRTGRIGKYAYRKYKEQQRYRFSHCKAK